MDYQCACLTCQISRAINKHWKDDNHYYDFLHDYLDVEDWMFRDGCQCARCEMEWTKRTQKASEEA